MEGFFLLCSYSVSDYRLDFEVFLFDCCSCLCILRFYYVIAGFVWIFCGCFFGLGLQNTNPEANFCDRDSLFTLIKKRFVICVVVV